MIRKHISEYRLAQRDIELTQTAIDILERVSNSSGVIRTLKRKQQVQLRRIDRAKERIERAVRDAST